MDASLFWVDRGPGLRGAVNECILERCCMKRDNTHIASYLPPARNISTLTAVLAAPQA